MTLEEILRDLRDNPFQWKRNDIVHLSTAERLIRLAYEAGKRDEAVRLAPCTCTVGAAFCCDACVRRRVE